MKEVEWGDLEHAYGSAKDVPQWLQGLVSKDAEKQKKGRYWLAAALNHQSSRYPASVAAVPFLVEAALSPAVEQREWILDLLVDMGVGEPQYVQNFGVHFEKHQEEINREWDPQHLYSYYAVEGQLTNLLPLAKDPDPAVRASLVYLLSMFSRMRYATRPVLVGMAASETDVGIQTSLSLALSLLDYYDGNEAGWAAFASKLTPDAPSHESAVAVYVARRYGDSHWKTPEMMEKILSVVVQACSAPSAPPKLERVRWKEGYPFQLLMDGLQLLTFRDLRRATADRLFPFLAGIDKPDPWARDVAQMVLPPIYTGSTTNEPPENGWPSAEQTPPELRRLVTEILRRPALLSDALLSALPNDGLPSSVEELREFFGVPDPDPLYDVEVPFEGRTATFRELIPKARTSRGGLTLKSFGGMKARMKWGKNTEPAEVTIPIETLVGDPDAVVFGYRLASEGIATGDELIEKAFAFDGARSLEAATKIAALVGENGIKARITNGGTEINVGGVLALVRTVTATSKARGAVPPVEFDRLLRLATFDDDAFETAIEYFGLLPQERRDQLLLGWAEADFEDGLARETLTDAPSNEQRARLAALVSPKHQGALAPKKGNEGDEDEDEDEDESEEKDGAAEDGGGLFAPLIRFFRSLLG